MLPCPSLMTRDEFETSVRHIVSDGGSVTTSGAAAKFGVARDRAKEWLEAMYTADELELDLEGEDIVYKRGSKLGGAAPGSTPASGSRPERSRGCSSRSCKATPRPRASSEARGWD